MVRMPMGLRRPSPSSASSILVVSSAMSVAQARPCEVSAISISRLLAQAMRVTRPASVRRESAREKVGASRQEVASQLFGRRAPAASQGQKQMALGGRSGAAYGTDG